MFNVSTVVECAYGVCNECGECRVKLQKERVYEAIQRLKTAERQDTDRMGLRLEPAFGRERLAKLRDQWGREANLLRQLELYLGLAERVQRLLGYALTDIPEGTHTDALDGLFYMAASEVVIVYMGDNREEVLNLDFRPKPEDLRVVTGVGVPRKEVDVKLLMA